MLPGCHGDLKGGAGAKLHNLIYAGWEEEAEISRAGSSWKVEGGPSFLPSREAPLGTEEVG